jgi:hypothetical protein
MVRAAGEDWCGVMARERRVERRERMMQKRAEGIPASRLTVSLSANWAGRWVRNLLSLRRLVCRLSMFFWVVGTRERR